MDARPTGHAPSQGILASTRRRYAAPEPYALIGDRPAASGPGRTRYVCWVSAGASIQSGRTHDLCESSDREPQVELIRSQWLGGGNRNAAAKELTAKAAATARRARSGNMNRWSYAAATRPTSRRGQRPQSRPLRAGGRARRQSRARSTRSRRAGPARMAPTGSSGPETSGVRMSSNVGSSPARGGPPTVASVTRRRTTSPIESDQAQTLMAGVGRPCVGWGLALPRTPCGGRRDCVGFTRHLRCGCQIARPQCAGLDWARCRMCTTRRTRCGACLRPARGAQREQGLNTHPRVGWLLQLASKSLSQVALRGACRRPHRHRRLACAQAIEVESGWRRRGRRRRLLQLTTTRRRHMRPSIDRPSTRTSEGRA